MATNIGLGGSYDYTLTFTLAQGFELSSFSIDFLLYSAGGCAQSVNRSILYNLSVETMDGVSLLSYTDQSTITTTGRTEGHANYSGVAYNSDGSVNSETKLGTASFALGDSITFAAGTEYTLKIANIAVDGENGTFVGIGNIAMTGQVVPEPASATLTLLAFSTLALRRRRQ